MSVDADTRDQIVAATERAAEHMTDPTPVQVLSQITTDIPDDLNADDVTPIIQAVLDGTDVAEIDASNNGHATSSNGDDSSSADGTDDTPGLRRADVRDHHRRIKDAVAPLGSVDGNPTMLVNDKAGWYITEDNVNPSDDELGTYEKQRRARDFTQDYDAVVAGALKRTLYALTSYKRPAAFEDWAAATLDETAGEYDYLDSKPSPTAEDLMAVAAWGDVDLTDDLKPDRPSLDEETYETAEATLDAYVDEFAALYGGRDAVYVLDSVGGAYIFGAPEATLPIAEYFADDEDARTRVLEAFIERSNEYLQAAEGRVNERVDNASDVVHPDWANNINRQYKLPLTLHGDHDAVVTPVDSTDIVYREPTPIQDVDDELLDATQSWCEDFTTTTYTDRVDDVVETLWSDEYDEEEGNWRDALDAWVAAEREREREQRRQREAAQQRREERLQELDDSLEGTPITPFMQDVYDALDAIDTADVIRRHACDAWDTGTDASGKTEFNPSWRTSSSGSSCYVDHEENTFGDPGDGGGGFAAKAMALGKGIITDANQSYDGEQWGEGVDALRDAGYDVPVWTPEQGSTRRSGGEYEQMPLWAVRKAAVALGVVPDELFIEREGEDGGTYLGFPGTESYNNALEAIADAGLDHGREYMDTGPQHPIYELAASDDDDLELYLVPINGMQVRIEIHQNDQLEYTERQDRGFWDSGTKRGRIAGRVVDELTGYDETFLREAIKEALTQVALDSDEDWFEDAMRSPREEALRDRTERVVCYPGADDARWVVTMRPSTDAPEEEPQRLKFDAGQLQNADPGHFQTLHLGAFLEKAQLDSAEWANLVDYWLDIQDRRAREMDNKLEAAIETFLSNVNRMKVWADEDGYDWDKRNGYYAEGYADGNDAVLIPGSWVMQWKSDNDYGDLALSTEFRERDIMLTSSTKESISGKRRRVWPIDAEQVDWTPETAMQIVEDDDENDDKPEGLRD